VVSKVDSTTALLAVIDYLLIATKQNPNDADLGGEVRKFTKELNKIRNKYRNYE